MSNHIHGCVGYGLKLNEEGRFAKFKDESQKANWSEELLSSIYPEGSSPITLEFHFLKEPTGKYDEPLAVINLEVANASSDDVEISYGVTGSGDGAENFSAFLSTLEKRRAQWDEAFADFVRRCETKGLILYETKPHPIMYLHWDDGIMGRGVTPSSRY